MLTILYYTRLYYIILFYIILQYTTLYKNEMAAHKQIICFAPFSFREHDVT